VDEEFGDREPDDRVSGHECLELSQPGQRVIGSSQALVRLDQGDEGALEVRLERSRDLVRDVEEERDLDAVSVERATETRRCADGGLEIGRRLLECTRLQREAASNEGTVGQVRGPAQVSERHDLIAFDHRAQTIDEGLLFGRGDESTEEREGELLMCARRPTHRRTDRDRHLTRRGRRGGRAP